MRARIAIGTAVLTLVVGCAGTGARGAAPAPGYGVASAIDVPPTVSAGAPTTAGTGWAGPASSVGTSVDASPAGIAATSAGESQADPGSSSEVTPVDGGPPASGVPTSVTGLAGRTFELVGLFTDAGGADTKFPDSRFVLRFGFGTATADTSCGRLDYPVVEDSAAYDIGGLTVDLGEPSGPTCTLGADPSFPPSGLLGFGRSDDGRYVLSTGVVAWLFREV